MVYGYVRVSTKEQNEDRQLIAMKDYGVTQVITDKESGKDFNRPGYAALIKGLKENDTIVVESLDRLGRNYADIIEQWRVITKVKGASIVVIDMPLLDTREKRDLMGTLISDIVLQLLSYVAQTEREFNRKRSAEGIAAAKARGVIFGRPRMERGENYQRALKCWKDGMSANEASKIAGISRSTFLKWARENPTTSDKDSTAADKASQDSTAADNDKMNASDK